MKISLCTLYEGHYHYGVAALANSLLNSGYAGELFVGFRGPLPNWAAQHPGWNAAQSTLELSDRFSLRFLPQTTAIFFTYYKAHFMHEVMQVHSPDADTVAYIDPDIVLKCNWVDVDAWFHDGIGLIEDVNWNFPSRHPKRLMWKNWFAQHGVHEVKALDRYYNAGFLSVPREHAEFLVLLDRLCMMILDYNEGHKHIKAGEAADLFHSTDQDAMNFALGVYQAPLNTAGCEAMDFSSGGFYFSHAIGYSKPWLGRHLRLALRGWPPSNATKAYYRYANNPIQVFSGFTFAIRRLSLWVASAMGRVYRKA
ncbi:hypothetical protein QTH91_01940 [Variovorax dokdonensis]|uniref:Uncharacterized protein n=1 Tax=Variovorax dokdonensis TaxID=344883 RepID=A0ABT7N5N4_9BURK|nr:hypothetical protein [Variovorax dokdonensis]MDM0043233.1 hypothetical protein [Variovorax dokdonensis]